MYSKEYRVRKAAGKFGVSASSISGKRGWESMEEDLKKMAHRCGGHTQCTKPQCLHDVLFMGIPPCTRNANTRVWRTLGVRTVIVWYFCVRRTQGGVPQDPLRVPQKSMSHDQRCSARMHQHPPSGLNEIASTTHVAICKTLPGHGESGTR